MFDDVHFTGNINLGNVVNALIYLISVIALYIKVKTFIAEQDAKNKLPGGRRKDDPPIDPVILPPPDKDGNINVDK